MNVKHSVVALVLLGCVTPSNAQTAGSPVDTLLATAGQDTVLVLVDYIEELEMQAKLDAMSHGLQVSALLNRIDRLEVPWWRELITDPRLWFILGAGAGISVAEAR